MKIRRDQLRAFEELQRRERRAYLVKQLTAGDDRASIDPESGDVLLEDARGNVSRVEVGEQGITGIFTAEHRHFGIAHDEAGRPVRYSDSTDQSFEIDYTEQDRVREVRSGETSLLHLDYSEDLASVDATFADGAVEHLEYSGKQLIRTIDANGNENRFDRDSESRVTEIVDPRGQSTRFDYDDADGSPLRTIWADGTTEEYEENEDELVVKVNGQLRYRVTSDDARTEERAEFADGKKLFVHWDGDRPVEAANEHAEVVFEYDGEGHLVGERQGEHEVACEFDEDGDLVSLTTPDDERLRFDYDGDNLLVGVTDWDGRTIAIERHSSGGISRIAFPNDVTTQQTISNNGYTAILTRSPALPAESVVDERYEYDLRSRLSARISGSRPRHYAYDRGGRLIEESDPGAGALERFEYDTAGNRIQAGLDSAAFDERNRIVSSGSERFGHDIHGNLTSRSGKRSEFYSYNDQGLLVEVRTADEGRVEFAYDPFGRRIRKRRGDTTTHFVWAGRQLIKEWTTRGGEVVERRDYLFLPGEHYPLAVRIDGRSYYYHADRLGTPLAVTDEQGRVVWKAEYDAFGEARVLVEEIRQPLRFAGQYRDDETHLHYNVFRYYDPTLGRYVTPDPIRYAGGSTNLYEYAGNDPINRRDPEGHIVFCTALLIIGGAALLGGLIGGAVKAYGAGEGKKGEAFLSGFGWGALAGAVGAAVPIIGAAAGLGAAAIGAIAVAGDAVVAGAEACSDAAWDLATFGKAAGISAAMTLGTLGLAKIPGVKRALGAVGKRLSGMTDDLTGGAKKLWNKFIRKKPRAKPSQKPDLNVGNECPPGECTIAGHPVDVATGKVFTDFVDFVLPGPIPFRWERIWYSTSTYGGPLGHGWHSSYDLGLRVEDEEILVRMADGRVSWFPRIERGAQHFDRTEHLTLFCDSLGYGLIDRHRLRYRFRDPGGSRREQPLAMIYDQTALNEIRFAYDANARLTEVVASGGQSLQFSHDPQGRIAEINGPDPVDSDARMPLVRYAYDGRGNLVEAFDALGQPAHFEYSEHLLIKETDRNGLSFHFEYAGSNESARCVHTWGDAGIYERRLAYDVEAGTTTVEDSRGNSVKYQHEDGRVVRTTDALGATWTTAFNEFKEVIQETDPLSNATGYAYDERGNRSAVLLPDGAALALSYDEQDNPVEATDALGGNWTWTYDEHSLLQERQDPLGNRTRYRYQGRQLVAIIDANDQTTHLQYDAAGNFVGMVAPNGEVTRWQYDGLGRAVSTTDPKGNVQRRQFDLLNRVLQVQEPDGNTRHMSYDREGNVTHIRDSHHDVALTYSGMGCVASRSESNTTVRFEYDNEENLESIVNEQGQAYRFEWGPTGEIASEIGFDEERRVIERDPLGRLVQVERPGGLRTRFEYDAAGRVTTVQHSDGTAEHYAYRSDGELTIAANETTALTFERDPLGRIVEEAQGEHWVRSEYDALGRRTRMTSSLGARQTIKRNAVGDVDEVDYGDGVWQAAFERDSLGLELERVLPGGVRNRWQRDQLGRPVVHEISSSQETHRNVRYEWGHNNHLERLIDAQRGPIRFDHDPLGRLAAVEYPDGTRDLRMPDAVSNLFRTEERSDRTYGRAGQLLEAIDASGAATRYEYDAEGNLIKKTSPSGRVWHYHWNAAGMLVRVGRPDGRTVHFTYDALGRRLTKTFRGKATCWVWDGENPLHEWVQNAPPGLRNDDLPKQPDVPSTADSLLALHPPNGPPASGEKLAFEDGAYLEDFADESQLITWLFEPESFSPMAKLGPSGRESILTDHLGTPVAMLDDSGRHTWAATLDSYGDVRTLEAGKRDGCPFRFPGQYEDPETGLYYNRYRYYDPAAGLYVSRDPIGLAGGLRAHAYVHDPGSWSDPLGLALEGVDFSGSPDLYPAGEGQKNTVTIKMQGARGRDFTEANKKAKLSSTPDDYTWHHVDDFDPKTGTTTMQLVRTEAHEATFPHKGSVSQFEKEFGVEYTSKGGGVEVAEKKGWLTNPLPKKRCPRK